MAMQATDDNPSVRKNRRIVFIAESDMSHEPRFLRIVLHYGEQPDLLEVRVARGQLPPFQCINANVPTIRNSAIPIAATAAADELRYQRTFGQAIPACA